MINKIKQKIRIYLPNIFHLDITLLKKGKGFNKDRYLYQKLMINKDGEIIDSTQTCGVSLTT